MGQDCTVKVQWDKELPIYWDENGGSTWSNTKSRLNPIVPGSLTEDDERVEKHAKR